MNKLFHQHYIKGIGSFVNVLYLTSPLFGLAMYLVNASTFYAVISDKINKYAPWLSFPLFISLLIVSGLLLLFIFYKFVYPSYYAFLNRQTYIHQNPIQEDLKKIKEKLRIKDEL